jgi:hypothetical protein
VWARGNSREEEAVATGYRDDRGDLDHTGCDVGGTPGIDESGKRLLPWKFCD